MDFGQDRPIHTVKLYIYADIGVHAPSSYSIQYWNGSPRGPPLTETSRSPAIPTAGRANVVEFTEIATSRVRAVLSRSGTTPVGMTEFEAWGPKQPIADPPASDNLALNADSWKYPRVYPSFAYRDAPAFRANDGRRGHILEQRRIPQRHQGVPAGGLRRGKVLQRRQG